MCIWRRRGELSHEKDARSSNDNHDDAVDQLETCVPLGLTSDTAVAVVAANNARTGNQEQYLGETKKRKEQRATEAAARFVTRKQQQQRHQQPS